MNKTELLEEISLYFYKVSEPRAVVANPAEEATNIIEKLTRYSVTTYERRGNELVRGSVDFNVYDGGTAEEQAFYTAEFNKRLFEKEVENEVNSKITTGHILKGVLFYVNEALEFAVVDTYKLDVDIVSEQKYFVYKENSIIQFKKMG